MLAVLQSATTATLPLLPALLVHYPNPQGKAACPAACASGAQSQTSRGSNAAAVHAAIQDTAERFGLNAEQRGVLSALQPWFHSPSQASGSALLLLQTVMLARLQVSGM
jgi:hypothetical protein